LQEDNSIQLLALLLTGIFYFLRKMPGENRVIKAGKAIMIEKYL
jgi:hypothetical protein